MLIIMNNKILPVLKLDSSKYSSFSGEHLSFTPLKDGSTNAVITSQYLMYTTKSTTNKPEFYKHDLTITDSTASILSLILFETYLFQLVVESNLQSYVSNTLELIVTSTKPKACTITNIVPLDNSFICDIVYGESSGSPVTSIKFILNDSVNIFSITRDLPNNAPVRFTLSSEDNILIKNYKNFELSCIVKNVRGESLFSNSISFITSDLPNVSNITSIVENDKQLFVTFTKPSDYYIWYPESYTVLVLVRYKKSTSNIWLEDIIDVKLNDTLVHTINNLENGYKYDVKVAFQNDNGIGLFSNVIVAIPHTKCGQMVSSLFNLQSNLIEIKSVVTDASLGGLEFDSCQIDVHENDNVGVSHSIVDRVFKNEFIFSLSEDLKAYLFLTNRKYTFKVYINTKSKSNAINKNIVKGDVSIVPNIVYYRDRNKVIFDNINVTASNNSVKVDFKEIRIFRVPVINVIYNLYQNNEIIKTFLSLSTYSDMGNILTADSTQSFVHPTINGQLNNYYVTCDYEHAQFSGAIMESVKTQTITFSSFDVAAQVTNLHITDLNDDNLKLNWNVSTNLNGGIFKYYEIYQNNVMVTTTTDNFVILTNLIKGTNYTYKIKVITERQELNLQTFSSLFSESKATRTFSIPGSVVNLTSTVLDKSVKINWNGNADSGGYSVNRFSIKYKAESETDENYLEAQNVVSPATISGLKNGIKYQFQIFAHSYNNELQTTLTSLPSTIFIMPLSIPSKPQSLRIEPKDGFAMVFWESILDNGGSNITKYVLYVQNMTTNVVQMFDVNKDDVQVATGSLLNGTNFKIQLSCITEYGESDKTTEQYITTFGVPTISNITLFNKTINFSVLLNGEKIDDVNILAIDSSPNIDESLYLSSVNTSLQNSGTQNFSKTFSFNSNIEKYIIFVRTQKNQIYSTNFNTSMM